MNGNFAHRKISYRIANVLAVLLMVISITAGPLAFADFAHAAESGNATEAADATKSGSDDRTVTVGYYQSDSFQEGTGRNEPKSGYSYEYLQAVALHTGWTYEYVYGDWTTLYNKFVDGEIDLMAGVSYLDERKDLMLFPDSIMGSEAYYIYRHTEDTSINADDISSFDGVTIGGIKDNLMTDKLNEWLEDNNAKAEVVMYNGFAERDVDFGNGVIDCTVNTNNNVSVDSGQAPVVKVGEEPYYLCVAKDRKDLLKQLNDALDKINEEDPNYTTTLTEKYFGDTAVSGALSEEEIAWINEHDSLKAGYLNNYMPYSGTDDNGKVTGIVKDILPYMMDGLSVEYNPEITYTGYDSYSEMIKDLRNGRLDLAFPAGGGIWRAEQSGIRLSDPVVTAGMSIVYKGSYSENKTKSVAVNRNNEMQKYYVINNFPDAEISYFKSIDECLKAVASGKVQSTVVNGLRTTALLDESDYNTLYSAQLKQTDDRCFAVADGNIELLGILNHGIEALGDGYGINASYKYIDSIHSFTLEAFIKENTIAVIVMMAILLVIVALILISLYRRARRTAEFEAAQSRKLEEALIQAEKANASRTQFLSRMSHDIRTPLNGIIGMMEINERHPDDLQLVTENRAKARVAADHLLSLINDVLELSKMDDTNVTLAHEAFDLKQLEDDVITISRMKAENSGITLIDSRMCDGADSSADAAAGREKIDKANSDDPAGGAAAASGECGKSAEPGEGGKSSESGGWITHDGCAECRVYGSPLHVRQILVNIFGNAVQYNKPGGTVTGRMGMRHMDDGRIMFTCQVTDTGIGMSEKFLEHVFEPFSQEHTDARSTFKGTGLGMSIVKALLDKMDGTIEIVSKVGEGSCVTINIPFEQAEPEAAPVIADESEFSMEGLRALLVEDNELNLEIAQSILEDEGMKVTTAVNGIEAVAAFADNPPGTFDVIFMDLMMPEMDGLTAAKEIRKMAAGSAAEMCDVESGAECGEVCGEVCEGATADAGGAKSDDGGATAAASGRPDAATIPIFAMTANAFEEDKEKTRDAGMDEHLTKPIDMHAIREALAKHCR